MHSGELACRSGVWKKARAISGPDPNPDAHLSGQATPEWRRSPTSPHRLSTSSIIDAVPRLPFIIVIAPTPPIVGSYHNEFPPPANEKPSTAIRYDYQTLTTRRATSQPWRARQSTRPLLRTTRMPTRSRRPRTRPRAALLKTMPSSLAVPRGTARARSPMTSRCALPSNQLQRSSVLTVSPPVRRNRRRSYHRHPKPVHPQGLYDPDRPAARHRSRQRPQLHERRLQDMDPNPPRHGLDLGTHPPSPRPPPLWNSY